MNGTVQDTVQDSDENLTMTTLMQQCQSKEDDTTTWDLQCLYAFTRTLSRRKADRTKIRTDTGMTTSGKILPTK